ncbi:MAG TPA: hypothetical protein VEB21_11115 [Terriglobales bacterium]|nr:hypothetical protein [Terriglobales bacterium]
MTRIRIGVIVAAMALTLVATSSPAAAAQSSDQRRFNAMWWSILHPGVGEWYLKGWGGFINCPQKKFWLGFIPIYGWPGYLQVKSAIDARNGRTNDSLTF